MSAESILAPQAIAGAGSFFPAVPVGGGKLTKKHIDFKLPSAIKGCESVEQSTLPPPDRQKLRSFPFVTADPGKVTGVFDCEAARMLPCCSGGT